MNATAAVQPGPTDEGMGLIEIVVAMFVLALVSLAFLPLLVQGIQQSSANATLVTATQLVNQEIELARDATCTASAVARMCLYVAARGVSLRVLRTTSPCPAALPGTFEVSAEVVREDTGASLAEASTLVYQERG